MLTALWSAVVTTKVALRWDVLDPLAPPGRESAWGRMTADLFLLDDPSVEVALSRRLDGLDRMSAVPTVSSVSSRRTRVQSRSVRSSTGGSDTVNGDRSFTIRIGESVTLTPDHVAWAVEVGTARERQSLSRGDVDRRCSTTGTSLQGDFEGGAAELAWCVLMYRTWSGSVGTYKAPDSGDFDHIRSTTYRTGHLVVRSWDPDDGIYSLMVGTTPTFTFKGSATGVECRKPTFLSNPGQRGAAHFVPQRVLGEYADVLRWYLRWNAVGRPPMLTQAEIQW